MPERKKIKAIILAAGESVRFKPGPKALPPPLGADLLNLTVKSLALVGLVEPMVIVNPKQPKVKELVIALGCPYLVNPRPELGMFSSVKLVFAQAKGEAALVLPVDAGFLTADSILTVIDYFLALDGHDHLAILPAYGEKLGHPPIIGPRLLSDILLYEGQGGLRGALAHQTESSAESKAIMEASLPKKEDRSADSKLRYLPLTDPLILTDIDNREDLSYFEEVRKNSAFIPTPTAEKALTLLELGGVERKKSHCLAVAVAALRLAQAIGSEALFLTFISGVLHDLCHGQNNHAEKARERLLSLGWEQVAAVVGNHTELSESVRTAIGLKPRSTDFKEQKLSSAILEASLCVYQADKYLKGSSLVDLETRFSPTWARDNSEVLAYIQLRKEDALDLDDWFKKRLSAPIEKILITPTGHPLEQLADQAAGGSAGPK
ncbi:MAG: NTP transferase domain-containing protein [Deltaproteobacteria bacterium]|jgi:CTP:molybdopterin cytidylyltransferase MocA|nr:NTP transferase domain-containing protein [Deltaproteobacteria bacterium]